MKKAPQLWRLEDLPGMRPVSKTIPTIDDLPASDTDIGGKWMPARPLGHYSLTSRLRLAWMVFTGKCDALKWPGGQ